LTVLVRTLEFVKDRPTLGSDAAMQKQLISRALAARHPRLRPLLHLTNHYASIDPIRDWTDWQIRQRAHLFWLLFGIIPLQSKAK
jgi:hypothetical protein